MLTWIAIGIVVWFSGTDEEPSGGVLEEVTDPDVADAPRPLPADARGAEHPEAPRLERTVLHEPAAKLVARLKMAKTPAQRAEITAWLRAHPDHVGALLAALGAAKWHYAHEGWAALLRHVFGPLQDLEPQLAVGLITSLDAAPHNRMAPLALGALQALAPLGAPTRRGLETWIRANPRSPWLSFPIALAVESAESGEEIEPFVNWFLSPETDDRVRIHLDCLLRAVATLGARARSLTPMLAEYVLTLRMGYRTGVETLIAIGGDHPDAQRVLVAMLGSGGPGLGPAYGYFRGRDDERRILVAALEDRSPRVRMAAVGALDMQGGASRAVLLPVVLGCLTCEDALWRDKAMRRIAYMATSAREVVPTLEEMFRSRKESLWVTAAKTLQLLAARGGALSASDRRGFDVTSTLESAARHPNVRVRRLIVKGLMNYPPGDAVPILREALRDSDAGVREHASDALGELAQDDTGALAALKEAAGHQDPRVVAMAQAWLVEIEGERK